MELRNEFDKMEYSQLTRSDSKYAQNYGAHGVFRACCQPESLHKAHTSWPPIGENACLPVIQLCHWVTSKSSLEHIIIFADVLYGMPRKYNHDVVLQNCKDKYVIFTDITKNASSILAECMQVNSFEFLMSFNIRGTADTISFNVQHFGTFEPVKPNHWYATDRYVFRLQKIVKDIPACVSVHKTVPFANPQCIANFSMGSTKYWNPLRAFDKQFILECPIEEKNREREGPLELPQCCKNALLGIQNNIGTTVLVSSNVANTCKIESSDILSNIVSSTVTSSISNTVTNNTVTNTVSPITQTFSNLQMTSPKHRNDKKNESKIETSERPFEIIDKVLLWYPSNGEYAKQWAIYKEALEKYGPLVTDLAARTNIKSWSLKTLDARRSKVPNINWDGIKELIIEDSKEFII